MTRARIAPDRRAAIAVEKLQEGRAVDPAQEMLDTIVREARATGCETGRPQLRSRVLEAIRSVPRDAFVPGDMVAHAYDNRPLPIGAGQTISQPFIVALMTDLLDPESGDRMLEVGTGCGYQAAVLSRLVDAVYTIESIGDLGREAEQRLASLGCDNVQVRVANGRDGWPEAAPFDGILVTAGATSVPPALVEQLAPGGRLVIPVGSGRHGQQLRVLTRREDGRTDQRTVLPVAFVPLQSA